MSITSLLYFLPLLCAHGGPDPLMSWRLSSAELHGSKLSARLGPDPRVSGAPLATPGPSGGSLMFDGIDDRMVVAKDIAELGAFLPKRHFTISTWVSVNTPQSYGEGECQ